MAEPVENAPVIKRMGTTAHSYIPCGRCRGVPQGMFNRGINVTPYLRALFLYRFRDRE